MIQKNFKKKNGTNQKKNKILQEIRNKTNLIYNFL